MIEKVEMYTITCDYCKKDLCEKSEYSAYNSKEWVEEIAMESDWIRQNDEHYCSDCYEYDDEDNLIIKKRA